MKPKKPSPLRYAPNQRRLYPLSLGHNRGQLLRGDDGLLKAVQFNVSRAGALDAAALPSRVSATHGNPTPAPAIKKYTGTKMLGIATLHKSVEVPVFSQEQAEAIAHMRR